MSLTISLYQHSITVLITAHKTLCALLHFGSNLVIVLTKSKWKDILIQLHLYANKMHNRKSMHTNSSFLQSRLLDFLLSNHVLRLENAFIISA